MKKLFRKLIDRMNIKTSHSIKNTIKTSKYMLKYVWHIEYGKKYIVTKSLVSILTAVVPILLIYMPGLIINELAGDQRIDIILIYICITAVVPFIQSLIVSFLNAHLTNLRYNLMIKVKTDFISHCADMDYESMENPDIQLLKERAEETISNCLDTFEHLSGLITSAISVVMCTSIISILNPLILILVLFVVLMNYINNRWISEKTFLMNNEIQKYNRYGWPILSYFSDLRYAKEIRLYDLKNYFINLYVHKRIEANKFGIKNASFLCISRFFAALVTLIQTILLYIYFAYQIFESNLPVGSMTIYMGIVLQFTGSLTTLTRQYINLSTLSLKVQELITFMDIPIKNSNSGNKVPYFDSNSVIEFKNVSFKYPGSEKYALKNVSIKISGDEKLCIVGSNGSGKSTFVKLLTRLYVPTEGEILLNGISIFEYDYLQYLRLFAPVFQDFALYNISIKENIIMSDKYNYGQLAEAIRQSGLSQLVNTNKNGYDTIIHKWFDSEGIEPSGGEGQRIAIARAVYHGGNIFILDEPTAALDPNAEYEIYTQFNDIIANRAAVFVTHRLSAVQLADKVAVFDNGKIVEYGKHLELYASDGIYKEMFEKQAEFYTNNTYNK